MSTLAEFRENGYVSAEERAFWKYLTEPSYGVRDPRELLDEEESRVLNKTTTAGGYLVPQSMAKMVVSASRSSNPVAGLAQEFVTSDGSTFLLPVASVHGTATWTAESVGYTLSDETFAQTSLSAFKATSIVKVTEELATDAQVEFDAFLGAEMGSRLGSLESAAYATGSGTGQPLGVVNAGSPYGVTTAATGSSVTYKLADLIAVYKALNAAYRSSASWLISPDDFASLAGLADTAGGLVLPSLQFDPPSLLGRPVYVWADLPAPAANAKSLIFGDFRQAYAIRRVQGVSVARLDELYAENGQRAYRCFERVDGRPTLTAGAQILAHSAT